MAERDIDRDDEQIADQNEDEVAGVDDEFDDEDMDEEEEEEGEEEEA